MDPSLCIIAFVEFTEFIEFPAELSANWAIFKVFFSNQILAFMPEWSVLGKTWMNSLNSVNSTNWNY